MPGCCSVLSAAASPDLLGLSAGCVENELGLREFLESNGHTYVVTADKEGDGCEFDKHLVSAVQRMVRCTSLATC